MSYCELVPHPALAPFVDRLWIRSAGGPLTSFRVLPDGCMDIMIDLAAGTTHVVGTMTRALVLENVPPRATAAVRFRPGGAAPFLGVTAVALTDHRIAGEDLGLGWLALDPLREAAGPAQAARRLEQLLLARLSAVPAPDPLVAHAVRALFAPHAPAIETLARQIGWSRQHLGRTFRNEVGLGPKTLARVARLQRAVAEMQGRLQPRPTPSSRVGLAGVAAAVGYFDEAHMDREFRALAGLTPRRVKGAAGSIHPIHSLLVEA